MSNLTNNTASLEALLNKANALPDKSDGIDTSDATITPDTVFLNETGYANGQKVIGTFTIEDEVSEQENLIAQIASALEGKAAGGGSNIETCIVKVYNLYMRGEVAYSTIENGEMVSKTELINQGSEFKEFTVLCNSMLVFRCEDMIGAYPSGTGGVKAECTFYDSGSLFVYTIYGDGVAETLV